jgi:hypothetical protein
MALPGVLSAFQQLTAISVTDVVSDFADYGQEAGPADGVSSTRLCLIARYRED